MPKDLINKALAFLGKKLDAIIVAVGGQKVDMTESNRRLEEIKDVILRQTTDLARAYPNEKDLNKLSEAAKQLATATEALQPKEELSILVSTLKQVSANNTENTNVLIEKQEVLKSSILEQTGILVKILNKEQDVSEIKSLNKAIKEVQKAVKGIKLEEKDVDFTPITKAIKATFAALEKTFVSSNNDIIKALTEGFSVMSKNLIEAINSIKPSGTIKLDEMQLRALKPKGNTSSVYGGPVPARRTKITRVTMGTADTEYNHTFQKGTVMWRIKLEATNASFNYSWTSGTLKVSGDASSYISIPASWLDSRDNAEYGAKTIYFESGTGSMTMEIEEGIA